MRMRWYPDTFFQRAIMRHDGVRRVHDTRFGVPKNRGRFWGEKESNRLWRHSGLSVWLLIAASAFPRFHTCAYTGMERIQKPGRKLHGLSLMDGCVAPVMPAI